jgi:hypothetical protein
MPKEPTDRLLSELERLKHAFDDQSRKRIVEVLEQTARRQFEDTESLIRFHEALLFLRAHPHDARMLRLVDRLLSTFVRRVEALAESDVDLTPLDYIENSGIAGTAISGPFSYDIARWLAIRFRGSAEIDWEHHERSDRLGSSLPRFLPLLDEDSLVEANIPYLAWIRAGRPRGRTDLRWLLECFERLDRSDREKGEIYDSLELWVQWKLGNSRASRTRNVRPVRRPFFHRGPAITRRDVSLEKELSPRPGLKRLSEREGLRMIDMLRETTTVRYRELYGITHGDPKNVLRGEMGRGVEIYLWGLPPERRLPLRAYHLGFTLKNGVPVNYIEGINLCGKMEVGFNTFYTFREGESAWVYSQVLRVLHHAAAAECISIDPYQLGFNNDEAIESGAYLFYRKLGFRPTQPRLEALTRREESRITSRPGYRVSGATLRKLAEGNAVYEVDRRRMGEWDRFQVRSLGLAVQRRMAARFGGDAARARAASVRDVSRILKLDPHRLDAVELKSFENLSLVLSLIEGLNGWTEEEKRGVVAVIRAKTARDESRYSRLIQKHTRLRKALIKLGS